MVLGNSDIRETAPFSTPPNEIMPGVLDHDSHVLLARPLQRRANLLRARRVDNVIRVPAANASTASTSTKTASLSLSVRIASDARAIGEDWIARVVAPNGVVDANWICGMEA